METKRAFSKFRIGLGTLTAWLVGTSGIFLLLSSLCCFEFYSDTRWRELGCPLHMATHVIYADGESELYIASFPGLVGNLAVASSFATLALVLWRWLISRRCRRSL